ncbi:nitrate reductase molybdenum cofactor assembly chaperone [Streptomyces sp. NPDC048045]|uniref:nitrate reductase molybdenum cofactor assembly chaperone n=1 Tax=Streptomyces sp. NPDC048045 TaxID=3154710 RepID=UPI003431D306
MNVHRAVHQAASLLLQYPDEEWPGLRARVAEALGRLTGPETEPLLRFCRDTAGTPLLDLADRYVTTFDRSRRRTLHLTHYTDGDTRHRGASLAALKAHYRQHGWEPAGGELPDHLPALLEFAARCPDAGRALLHRYRGALDLLADGLAAHHSPYLDVVRAVRTTLPAAPPAPVPPQERPIPVPSPLRHAPSDEGVRR